MTADIVIRGGTARRRDRRARPDAPTSPSPTGSITDIGDGLDGQAGARRRRATSSRPGFVDIHTHYDAQVFWDPALTPSCWHGVTSVVAGNCGFSIAPVRPEHRELLVRTLQHVEDMAPDTLFEGVPWDRLRDLPAVLRRDRARGTLLNYACYVGHTAVRLYVMGEAGYEQRRDRRRRAQHAAASSPKRWPPARPASRPRRHRRTTATGAGRCRRASPTSTSCARCVAPLRDAGKGVVALLPGEKVTHADVFDMQRARRPPAHVDRAAHGQGLPVAREDHGGQHRGARRRRRGVAAGVVPPAHVPDEPARAVHVQHARRRSRS